MSDVAPKCVHASFHLLGLGVNKSNMGIGISNSIRSTSNNDSKNNGNSSSIVTGHEGGSLGGESEKQFQEDHRENITFLELCCWHLLCAHIWVPSFRVEGRS